MLELAAARIDFVLNIFVLYLLILGNGLLCLKLVHEIGLVFRVILVFGLACISEQVIKVKVVVMNINY
jgi:hypothetical protein